MCEIIHPDLPTSACSRADMATKVSFIQLNKAGPESKLIYRIPGGPHCLSVCMLPGSASTREQQRQKCAGLAPLTLHGPPTPSKLVLLLQTQAFLPHVGLRHTNLWILATKILL